MNGKITRRYAMKKDTVLPFIRPEENVRDVLTTVLRQGAQELLMKAVEEEVQSLLTQYSSLVAMAPLKLFETAMCQREPFKQGLAILR